MAVALISLLVACIMMTSSKLDSSYEVLHMISKKRKDESQKFRFKSLFWAVLSTLVFLIMIVAISDFYEISKFDTTWNSTSISIYYLIIVGIAFSLLVCGVISIVIVVRANQKGNVISLPKILLCRRRQTLNQCQKIAIIFYQWIGSFAILLTSVAVSIHGIGIIVAALANPLQVFSSVATFVVGLFYLTYAFADVYDHYEDMFDVSPLPNYRSQVFLFISRILTHVLVFLFFLLFSYTYLTAVIFIGGDNSGVVSSIANILPIILLTFFTWLSKHELQKFINFESSSSSNDLTENPSFVEISTV